MTQPQLSHDAAMTQPDVIPYATPSPEWTGHRAVGWTLWSILAILFLILVLQINHRISTGHSGDFRHFYFAAGALLDHRDLYGPVPIDVIERAIRRPAGPVQREWYSPENHDRYLYPPLIALLYTPLARVQFETAQRIMLGVNAVLLLAGVVLTARSFVDRFDLRDRGWLIAGAALLGVFINLDKVHVELQMFQTNALMFFLFAVSLYWLDRRPMLAGVPLGVILNIKYLSLGLLPWLLIRRRWSTFSSCVSSAILFALLPALVSGWSGNLHNLTVAYGGLLQMVGVHNSAEQANVDDIRDYLSCSITSAMARLTPAGHSLLVPMICTAGVAGMAVFIVGWMYRRRGIPVLIWNQSSALLTPAGFSPRSMRKHEPLSLPNAPRPEDRRLMNSDEAYAFNAMMAVEFVSIIAATLCFSPQTNTRHLMLALLVTIPLSVLILGARDNIVRIPAIIGGLLIGVGFIFPPGGQSPASRHLAHGWFSIGGQCWCLLIAVLTLVWTGLRLSTSRLSEAPL